jgi:hypothetical protein
MLNVSFFIVVLGAVTLSVTMLNGAFCIVNLGVVPLSVILINVVMLSDVAPTTMNTNNSADVTTPWAY